MGKASEQAIDKPFPGLRPFLEYEAEIFFGRDRHRNEIVERLANTSFVAVIGPSGCGKSSLLRAGVVPWLRAGRFYAAGSRWRVETIRPENQPGLNLARAVLRLAGKSDDVGSAELKALAERLLADPVQSLPEELARHGLPPDSSVLIVVDQFEELFNAENREHPTLVGAFINFIVAVADKKIPSVYCIATMRSDHLGDCSQYPSLADTINKSLYLTPNLNDDEIRDAIELPVMLSQFGAEFADGLVERILADTKREPADQLPLMQHLMMRMWDAASRVVTKPGAIRVLTHNLYDKLGPVADAVDKHASEIVASLPWNQQKLVMLLFRQLTERREGATYQDIRRPTAFATIAAIAGLKTDREKAALAEVIDCFRDKDTLFVQPFTPLVHRLADDTRLDIVHECLIRKWKILRDVWIKEEWEAARDLRKLVGAAQKAELEFGSAAVRTRRVGTFSLHDVTRVLDIRHAGRADASEAGSGSSSVRTLSNMMSIVQRVRTEASDWAVRLNTALSNSWSNRQSLLQAGVCKARLLLDDTALAAKRIVNKLLPGDVFTLPPDQPARSHRYLDREDVTYFRSWLYRLESQGWRPNATWSSNYIREPADFEKGLNYLNNSHTSSKLWGAAKLLAMVLAGGCGVWFVSSWSTDARNKIAADRNAASAQIALAWRAEDTELLDRYRSSLKSSEAASTKQREEAAILSSWSGFQKSLLDQTKKSELGWLGVERRPTVAMKAIDEKFAVRLDLIKKDLNKKNDLINEFVLGFAVGTTNEDRSFARFTALLTQDAVVVYDHKLSRVACRYALPADVAPAGLSAILLEKDRASTFRLFFDSNSTHANLLTREGKLATFPVGGCGTPRVQSISVADDALNVIAVTSDGDRFAVLGRNSEQKWRLRVAKTASPSEAAFYDLGFETQQIPGDETVLKGMQVPPEKAEAMSIASQAQRTTIAIIFDRYKVWAWDVDATDEKSGGRQIDPKLGVPVVIDYDRIFELSPDRGLLLMNRGTQAHLWRLPSDKPEFFNGRVVPDYSFYDLKSNDSLRKVSFADDGGIWLSNTEGDVVFWPDPNYGGYKVREDGRSFRRQPPDGKDASNKSASSQYEEQDDPGLAQQVEFVPGSGFRSLSADGLRDWIISSDGSRESRLKLYDGFQPTALAVGAKARLIALGAETGSLAIFSTDRPDRASKSSGPAPRAEKIDGPVPSAKIVSVAVSTEQAAVWALSKTGTIFMAERNGAAFKSQLFETKLGSVRAGAVSLSASGDTAAVVTEEGALFLLSRTPKSRPTWHSTASSKSFGWPSAICTVSFGSIKNQSYLAIGTIDGEVLMSDLDGIALKRRFRMLRRGDGSPIVSLAFGLEGDLLVGGMGSTATLNGKSGCEAEIDRIVSLYTENVAGAAAEDSNVFPIVKDSANASANTAVGVSLHPLGDTALLTRAKPRSIGLFDLMPSKLGVKLGAASLPSLFLERTELDLSRLTPRQSRPEDKILPAQIGCDDKYCWLVSAVQSEASGTLGIMTFDPPPQDK